MRKISINFWKRQIIADIGATCYRRIDHLQCFIKTEFFFAWIDSSVCAESNGANLLITSYDH